MHTTATIKKLGFKGDGIVAVDGREFHIPYVIDGETVELDVTGDRAQLVKVVEASPQRVTPPCPYFGSCGGCSLQHLSAARYEAFKRSLVPDADGLILIPPKTRRRAGLASDGRNLGFNSAKSHDVVDIESCLLLKDSLNAKLPALRTLAPRLGRATLSVTEVDNGIDLAITAPKFKLAPESISFLSRFAQEQGFLRISINGEQAVMLAKPKVTFSGVETDFLEGAFLQPSKEGEDALVSLVLEGLKKKQKKTADLFCGLGTFAYAMRKGGYKVQGFDELTAHPFVRRDLEQNPLTARELNEFDAAVFDPPRAGAMRLVQNIAKSKLRMAVAVSCNPATFGRDRKVLENGGFTMRRPILVDQFIYSAHLELVAVFER